MKLGRCLFLPVLCGVLATASSAFAQTTYYALTDPGTTQPPAAPWVDAAAGVPFPPGIGDDIWIGKGNFHIPTNTKNWTIKGIPAGWGKVSSTGYVAGPPVVAAAGVTVSFVGDTLKIRLNPQPDWEVVNLQRTAAAGEGAAGGTPVQSWSHCADTESLNQLMFQNDAFFGEPVEDAQLLDVVEFYPVGGTIGALGSQVFTAANGGTWVASLSNTDPNGVSRPGVRWTLTAGALLAGGDEYNVTLVQAGPAVIDYDIFANDTVKGEFHEFRVRVKGKTIPSVSEWGLIVMVLLGLTAGTFMLGRRQHAAAA